jgi:hypothetical protein
VTADVELRVRVLDAWDDVVIRVPGPTPIADVKRRALDAAHVTDDPAGFLVKFRGAEVRDESRSVHDERVPSDGALIVMRRRRVPVR